MTEIITMNNEILDANGNPAVPKRPENMYPWLDKFEIGTEFHLSGCIFKVLDKPRTGPGGLLLAYCGPTKSERKKNERT